MPGNQLNPYGNRYSGGGGGGGSGSGVTSYNTRTGAVTAQASDVEGLFTAAGQVFVGTGSGTGTVSTTSSAQFNNIGLGVAPGASLDTIYIGTAGGQLSIDNAGNGTLGAPNGLTIQPGGNGVSINGPITLNSHKVTSLSNGTVSTDAAAFGQLSNGQIQGQILATKQYAPASDAAYAVNNSVLTALDTTNATLSITVPASGIVDINVSFDYTITVSGSANGLWIGLLNHSGGAQIGLTQLVVEDLVMTTSDVASTSKKFHLTGLTPGALQVDLAAIGVTTIHAMGFTGGPSGLGDYSPLIIQAVSSV